MDSKKSLIKQENKLNTYLEWFKKDKDKLMEFLKENHDLTEEQAKEVVNNPHAWSEFLGQMKKSLDAHKIKLIRKSQTQIEEALNKKQMGMAFDGAKTAKILSDTVFGEAHRPSTALNFYGKSGEPVSIKIGFDFKPFRKPSWVENEPEVIEAAVIEGEVEENGK